MLVVGFMICALLTLAAFLFGISIGHAGREQLRLELANLKGKHETLSGAYHHMREIAKQAIQAATLKHFPEKAITQEQHDQLETQFKFESVKPTYVEPEVKFCDSCSVSVRSETWPVKCPNTNCSAWIGDDWPGEIDLSS